MERNITRDETIPLRDTMLAWPMHDGGLAQESPARLAPAIRDRFLRRAG